MHTNCSHQHGAGLFPACDVEEKGASFDPFAGVEKSVTAQVRHRWWAGHVEKELGAHRSPFVAAEILLKQMDEYTNSSEEMEEIFIATILPVLNRCASSLGIYGDVFRRALHEVVPAVVFTRTVALSHGEVVERRSYAECFTSIKNKFNYHVKLASALHRRALLEENVMSRVVRRLDNLWLKMCFRAWRALRNHVSTAKRSFQRLATKGAALTVVLGHLKVWRRYAHQVTLREKLSKHSVLNKELEALYTAEQTAKSNHERIVEELKEKNRLLELTVERCMESEGRLKTIKGLLEETNASLEEHWQNWNETMSILFGDTNDKIPPIIGDLRSDIQSIEQNITDTAALYLSEAKKRTWKIRRNAICQYVMRAKLEEGVAERMAPDELIAMLRRVCTPVVPPLRLVDVVRDDQQKYDMTLKFLSCINDGGHCSLFVKSDRCKVEVVPVEDCTEYGKTMVSHVTAGVSALQSCPESNENYLLAIQRCLSTEELTKVYDYLNRVYLELAASGLPLNRAKIEKCIESIVEPQERQVVYALYPSHGIKNFSDMISYLSKISRLCLCSVTNLVECIESHYDADPREDLFSMLYDDDVFAFVNEHEKDISRIFSFFKDKRFPMLLSKERIKPFLIKNFNLVDDEVESMFQLGSSPDKVRKDEFQNFLTALAAFYTPSPFVPVARKLATVIDRCAEGMREGAWPSPLANNANETEE
ncbi:hypothetical protein ERJ75_000792600 [Trypanosoma vivax]|nr:hypothetical protein ERJ75_000792600 [Trypanosoma vivax]